MIINQFDHDHCNDHEYRDDGESGGGERTYCQEGGGDGQGAGSKNLKKEKLEQIYSCDDGKYVFWIILIMIPKDTTQHCHEYDWTM